MSIAKRGLKAGLQDFISSIKEFPEDLKSSIDNDLTANGLPNLKDLQGVVKTTIARVLNRKKINSLEEFYIVKEEVIDQTTDMVGDVRSILDKLLTEFEISKNKKNDI
jgi:CRISPR/Cas system CSM-associated protein Csm2 small subunit